MEKNNTVDEDIRVDQKINKYRKIVIYFSIFYIIIDVIQCILVCARSLPLVILSLIDIAFFGILILSLNKKNVEVVEIMFFIFCINWVIKGVSLFFSYNLVINIISFAIYEVFLYYIWEARKYLKIDEDKRNNNRNNNTKPENIV